MWDQKRMAASDPVADADMPWQPFLMLAMLFRTVAVASLLGGASPGVASNLPSSILRQLPSGYVVVASTASAVGNRQFRIVALRSRRELSSERYRTSGDAAPLRPLVVFELRPNRGWVAVGRNDKVIAPAGGGCDPFEEHHIATKGAYFTVENEVACGDHWTDYVTFRFEPRVGGFVFDNERFESWKFNPSNDPHAEALIPDVRRVWRAKDKLVPFSSWRPPAD